MPLNPTYKLCKIMATENSSHFGKNSPPFARILLGSPAYVNGLNPLVLLEWLQMVNMCQPGDHIWSHIARLMGYMEEGRYSRSLYAVCLCHSSRVSRVSLVSLFKTGHPQIDRPAHKCTSYP